MINRHILIIYWMSPVCICSVQNIKAKEGGSKPLTVVWLVYYVISQTKGKLRKTWGTFFYYFIVVVCIWQVQKQMWSLDHAPEQLHPIPSFWISRLWLSKLVRRIIPQLTPPNVLYWIEPNLGSNKLQTVAVLLLAWPHEAEVRARLCDCVQRLD